MVGDLKALSVLSQRAKSYIYMFFPPEGLDKRRFPAAIAIS